MCIINGVYEGYKIYGPYGSHRKIMVLYSLKHRTTMSYARYLMSLKLGRELRADEEVDHIDDDCLNDDIDNLQVLTPEQNQEKSNVQRHVAALVELTCPVCGCTFARLGRDVRKRQKREVQPLTCSKSCATTRRNKQKLGGVEQVVARRAHNP